MTREFPRQQLDPARTTWHITVGTYGTRLHGGAAPTVDREHNQLGEPFICDHPLRWEIERERMRGEPVWLSEEQRLFIEKQLPLICDRGGWVHRVCAAPPPPEHNHFHILCDAARHIHGKQIRQWMKRWLTEAMDARWGRPPGGSWWVEDGSTKPVKDESYLNNAFAYICAQRTTEIVMAREAQ